MADSVKIQIVVNGKVAIERELSNHQIMYMVGKSGDGKLCHACDLISFNSDGHSIMPLIKATTIDDA